MHRRAVVALGVSLGLASAVTAGAQPPRRPGLWDLQLTIPALKKVEHDQACVGAKEEVGAGYFWAGGAGSGGKPSWLHDHCDKPQTSPIPGGASFHVLCRDGPGLVFDMTGTAVGDFNSAYTLKMRSLVQTFFEGPPTPPMETTGAARWVGACPADMSPGDTRMVGDTPIPPP